MGKGDKKTKRGKIIMGSHGVRRPKRNTAVSDKPITMKKEEEIVKQKPKPKAVKKVKEV